MTRNEVESYQTVLNILTVTERCIRTANNILTSDYPKHALSEVYLDIASWFQSYIINADTLAQQIDGARGVPTPSYTRQQKAVRLAGKAIRNVVAHEGLWIPTLKSGVHAGLGQLTYLGISSDKVISSIDKVYEKRCHISDADSQRQVDAKRYIEDKALSSITRIDRFLVDHIAAVFPPAIGKLEDYISKPSVVENDTYQRSLNLLGLADILKRIKSYNCYPTK
ncbi:hypothetical protein [Idiomarina sp.]|uniref:hypothetical protein n=1 Tax=Idiomarina sp. TaxID=1874361 RepID=UPI002618134B|nr:hypothetical protein [Idiomarina sp.]